MSPMYVGCIFNIVNDIVLKFVFQIYSVRTLLEIQKKCKDSPDMNAVRLRGTYSDPTTIIVI